jgi:hypothetical protein
MLIFRKRFLTVADVHFGTDPGKGYASSDYPGIDAIGFLQNPEPVRGSSFHDSHTLLIDLTRDAEAIRSGIHRNTRYEINKAAKSDRLSYRFWKNPELAEAIERFCEFFSGFAGQMGIIAVSPAKLRTYASEGKLVLSEVLSSEGLTLTWHAYFVDKRRARLIHSASRRLDGDKTFKRLAGRANRYHHWQDFLRLKQEEVATYDFGGISPGTHIPEWRRITEFKQEFGGIPERTYNCELGLSLKGKVYLLLRRWYYRLRER